MNSLMKTLIVATGFAAAAATATALNVHLAEAPVPKYFGDEHAAAQSRLQERRDEAPAPTF